MATAESSASTPPATTTLDLEHVGPIAARVLRAQALFAERGGLIEKVGPDFYLVPSQDGERFYHVDYREESCDCPDFTYRGVACVHVYAVGVKLAKRRAKKSAACDGCSGVFPRRDLFEVGDDHLTFFEGDELCRECALDHGVL